MDERIARVIRGCDTFQKLAQFEENARERGALDDEVRDAIRRQSAVLGRALVAKRTGLDLDALDPAEERVIAAVSEYVGVMKRKGKDAGYTFRQIKTHGLLGAVESAVARTHPTQGFETLTEEGREDISYERIVTDFPEEFSPRALWYAQDALGLPKRTEKPPVKGNLPVQVRTEQILTWLEERSEANGGRIPPFTNAETGRVLGMDDLQRHGRALGNIQSRLDFACYRAGLPPLGLAAVAPFERAWQTEGQSWAFPQAQMAAAAKSRRWRREDFEAIRRETLGLSGQAAILWKPELSGNEQSVRAWAFGLTAEDVEPDVQPDAEPAVEAPVAGEAPYWVFVCNPKKWAIDRFLEQRIEHDTWGVNPHHAARFAPGQLAIVRVGVDQRNSAEREGRPKLQPGIYALCEVESEAFPAAGANDRFWNEDAARAPGWPTVQIRYLRTYADDPLTIERLRSEAPTLSHLLLNGFQAASFPIPADDFRTVLDMLAEEVEELPAPNAERDVASNKLSELEKKYLHASPEVKERLGRTIERGSVGKYVKAANGYKCQLCEALGHEPLGFRKRNGQHYVEAHHVMPVSDRQVGSLSASNILTACANHHRQMHYGEVSVAITERHFEITVDGVQLQIPRSAIEPAAIHLSAQ